MFDNKIVLITGSSRGIGAAIAQEFARQHAQVMLHGRDTEALAEVQKTITVEGGKALLFTADLTKFEEVEAMRKSIEQQAGPYGVRVNCIAPETILTDRNRERIPESHISAMAETHPLKRLGTPEDVAQATTFLASDKASWVTGAVIDITGGAVMA